MSKVHHVSFLLTLSAVMPCWALQVCWSGVVLTVVVDHLTTEDYTPALDADHAHGLYCTCHDTDALS